MKQLFIFLLLVPCLVKAQSVDQIIQSKIDNIASAITKKYDSIIAVRDQQIATIQKINLWDFDTCCYIVSDIPGGYRVTPKNQSTGSSDYIPTNITQTWYTAADTFVYKTNVINKGSSTKSGYVKYQVNGWDQFSIDLYGKISTTRQDMPLGTVGNQTMWAVRGSFIFAANTKVVTITNDRLANNDQVDLQVIYNGSGITGTMVSYNYPLHQFTVYLNASPTKETRIAYEIKGAL
jgi:hypothetical protein